MYTCLNILTGGVNLKGEMCILVHTITLSSLGHKTSMFHMNAIRKILDKKHTIFYHVLQLWLSRANVFDAGRHWFNPHYVPSKYSMSTKFVRQHICIIHLIWAWILIIFWRSGLQCYNDIDNALMQLKRWFIKKILDNNDKLANLNIFMQKLAVTLYMKSFEMYCQHHLPAKRKQRNSHKNSRFNRILLL